MEKATEHNIQWKKVKLGEVGEIVSGGTPSTSNEAFWDGGVLFVTPLDLGRKKEISSTIRTISELGVNNSSANKIKKNSLAISTRAPIGLMSIVNQEFTTNQGCKSIQFFDNYDCCFFYYYLLYNIEQIRRHGQGTTFMEISKTDFANIEISVPDYPAQRRIAAILSAADKVIEQTRQLISKYKSIKQGMMEDLLKPKEGWKKVKLGDICERITDGSHDSPKAIEDGYFMPSVKDMSYNCFDFSNCKQISENDYLRLKSSGCKPDIGDVLIAKDGSILKYCFVVEEDLPIVILSSIAILKPKQTTIDSHFLSFYFQKRDVVNDVVENYKSGTGVPRIVLRNFEKIEITYPDALQEQRRIAKILSGIDRKIEAEEKVLEKYEKMKKGLMERLLNQKDM